jgi:hypothetical protein
MKIKYMFLVILSLIFVCYASGDDGGLFALLIFGMFTGIIPALVIILAIGIIIGLLKAMKKTGHRVIHSEEYVPMDKDERRKEILSAIKGDQ